MSVLRNKGRLTIDIGWFIVVEFILCLLVIWNTFTGADVWVSRFFAVSLVVLLALFIIKFPPKADLLLTMLILIVVVSFMGVIFSWRRNDAAISFNNLKSYFLFCATIIYMYLSVRIELREVFIHRIIWMGVFLAGLFPIGYAWFNFSRTPYLIMNFTNPNLTSMYLLQAVLYAFIGISFLDKFLYKVICLGLIAINSVFLYWTEARNARISLLLFLALLIWCLIRNKNKISPIMQLGIGAFPLMFLLLYLQLIEWDAIKETFNFMVEEGKPLTSRVEIWRNILRDLKGYYLTGDYFELGGNAHNSHMVVLASFGTVALLLVIYYLYLILKEANSKCATKKQMICLLAFCCSLFMGMGEGALFSGGLCLYVMCCTPLLLARASEKNNTEV